MKKKQSWNNTHNFVEAGWLVTFLLLWTPWLIPIQTTTRGVLIKFCFASNEQQTLLKGVLAAALK